MKRAHEFQLTRHNNKSLWFTLDGRFCCVVGKLLCCCEQFVRRHTFLSFFDLAQSRAHVGRARERGFMLREIFSLSRDFLCSSFSVYIFSWEIHRQIWFLSHALSWFYLFWIAISFSSLFSILYERKWSFVCDFNFNFNKMKHKSFA